MTFNTSLKFDGGQIDPDMMRLLFGEPIAPEFSVTTTAQVEPLTPPRKRRGLTGKRYRIARRCYGRQRRAWRRAGSPMRTLITHVSRARLADVQPVGANTYSLGFTVPPRATGDWWEL